MELPQLQEVQVSRPWGALVLETAFLDIDPQEELDLTRMNEQVFMPTNRASHT